MGLPTAGFNTGLGAGNGDLSVPTAHLKVPFQVKKIEPSHDFCSSGSFFLSKGRWDQHGRGAPESPSAPVLHARATLSWGDGLCGHPAAALRAPARCRGLVNPDASLIPRTSTTTNNRAPDHSFSPTCPSECSPIPQNTPLEP